jgi:hypothetical protein
LFLSTPFFPFATCPVQATDISLLVSVNERTGYDDASNES